MQGLFRVRRFKDLGRIELSQCAGLRFEGVP